MNLIRFSHATLQYRRLSGLLIALLITSSVHAQLSLPDSLYTLLKTTRLQSPSEQRQNKILELFFELTTHRQPQDKHKWIDSLYYASQHPFSRYGQLLCRLHQADSLAQSGSFKQGYSQLLSVTQALERLHKVNYAAMGYLRMGAIVGKMHQTKRHRAETIYYYRRAVELTRQGQELMHMVRAMSYIGDFYLEQKNYKAVITSQQEAEQLILADKEGRAVRQYWAILANMGAAYLGLNKEAEANTYFAKAMQYVGITRASQKIYLAQGIYSILSEHYRKKKQYALAHQSLHKSQQYLDTLKGTVSPADAGKLQTDLYLALYNLHKEQANYQQALRYHELAQQQRNKWITDELDKEYEVLQQQYQTEQEKLKTISLQKAILQRESQQEQQFNQFLIALIVLLLITMGLVYRSLKAKAQSQLALSQLKQQTNRQVLAAQDAERQRIAADLHDDLGGVIATINHQITKSLQADSLQELQRNLATIKPVAAQAGDKIRSIAHNLMPPDFERIGLVESVQQLVASLNDARFQLAVFGAPRRLSPDFELNIYRILSELIHNVQKHAQASHVQVQLLFHTDSLTLLVEDDGIGNRLANNHREQTGIGLKNISSRVNYLNAHWQTDASEQGTTTLVEIPYEFLSGKYTHRR